MNFVVDSGGEAFITISAEIIVRARYSMRGRGRWWEEKGGEEGPSIVYLLIESYGVPRCGVADRHKLPHLLLDHPRHRPVLRCRLLVEVEVENNPVSLITDV